MRYRSEEDKVYCYENGVLKNKFNIRNEKILNMIEAELTSLHLADIHKNGIKGKFDFTHYKHIHKKIFGDIYPFAGKTRTVSISKGDTTFCIWMYIDEQMELIFEQIRVNIIENPNIAKLSKNDLILLISEYMVELNMIHPFREGNGRTLREYFRLLSLYLGYQLDYSECDKYEILEADIKGVKGDLNPLVTVLEKSLKKSYS